MYFPKFKWLHKKKVDSVSHDLKIVKMAVFGLSSSNLRFIVFLDKYFSTFQLTFFSVIEKVFMHKFADDLEPESSVAVDCFTKKILNLGKFHAIPSKYFPIQSQQ